MQGLWLPCGVVKFHQMEGKVLLAKLLALFTDKLNQELLDAIDYLQEEVRVLQHHLKKKCPKLVNAQRKVLAEKAKNWAKPSSNTRILSHLTHCIAGIEG